MYRDVLFSASLVARLVLGSFLLVCGHQQDQAAEQQRHALLEHSSPMYFLSEVIVRL